MRQDNEKADWISFGLHFFCGLLVGGVFGLILITRRRYGIWLNDDLILPYLVGTSLIGAGFGAKLGDRLWIGNNYSVIAPDAPEHSKYSLYVSVIVITTGALLVVYSLYNQFFG